MFEYFVMEMRESMIGDKHSGQKLQEALNHWGRQGWQLKAITTADVKGRLGAARAGGYWSPSSGRLQQHHAPSTGDLKPTTRRPACDDRATSARLIALRPLADAVAARRRPGPVAAG